MLLLHLQHKLSAQIGVAAVPYSVTYRLDDIREFEKLPTFDKLKMIKEDEAAKTRTKKQRFAKMISVAYQPYNSGTWETTEEGKVWRLGIYSAGAYSLYEVFGKFRLNPGVKLYVYNLDKTDFVGALTNANNNKVNVLAVAPLPGDAIIIELDVPVGTSDFGELELSQVWHDYINEFGASRLKSTMEDPSGSCNVDINCTPGKAWQTEKNAVCRLVSNGLLCTGTLINNAAGEKIPYLITACHCVEDSFAAASSIFFFGYERPECNVHGNERAFALSGSKLIATTNRELDFSLLKLYQYPPATYNPYFVGWDAGTDAPDGGVCIHHPEGDVKKISVDNDPLTNADFGEGFDEYSHWLVDKWDIGTTEGGSSGAPFFNKSHRLCGTLSGGDAYCGNSVNDYFLQFFRSWSDYPDSSRQLKHWLDPNNSGKTKIDGIYPYGQQQNPVEVYSNTKDEYLVVYKNNLKSGTISGHNSAKYTRFAEKFYTPTPIQLSGMYINIADRIYDDIFSILSLKVWQGNGKPGKEIYSQNEYYRSMIRSANNFFFFDSLVTVTDTFFVGYGINYTMPDSLVVYTALNRGNGKTSTMYVYNGTWHNINEVTKPTLNTGLAVGVTSPNGFDPTLEIERILRVVPNPATDHIRVEFSEDQFPVSVRCYTITGQQIALDYERKATGIRINTTSLKNGVYTLVVETKTTIRKGIFIIMHE